MKYLSESAEEFLFIFIDLDNHAGCISIDSIGFYI